MHTQLALAYHWSWDFEKVPIVGPRESWRALPALALYTLLRVTQTLELSNPSTGQTKECAEYRVKRAESGEFRILILCLIQKAMCLTVQ